MNRFFNSVFKLEDFNTTITKEVLAGLTTFMAMAYILFVNPVILSDAGMDAGAVFVVTAIVGILGCLLMAFIANYPAAIAPAMGDNAFFAYSVVIGMGIAWQTAMGAVIIAAILFSLVTLTKIRRIVIDAIPRDLKLAMASGIGIFIAFVGLQGGGIIVAEPSTLVTIGEFTPETWLTVFGFFFTSILLVLHIPAAIFLGMLGTAGFGLIFGIIPPPDAIVSGIPSIAPIFGEGVFHLHEVFTPQLISIALLFFFVAFFNTTGTLVGVAEQAGFVKNNKIPGIGKALTADSTAVLAGSLMGSTPACVYVESSAGIAVGGKTGLTALTVGLLFFLSLFFSPLLSVITAQVTAPILIIVGILMASTLKDIQWDDYTIAAPAFLILMGMPLTFNVSYGIGFGFLAYPVTMLAAKRGREVHPVMYGLAITFLILFYILATLDS